MYQVKVHREYKDEELPFVGHADLQVIKGIKVYSPKFGTFFGTKHKNKPCIITASKQLWISVPKFKTHFQVM